MRHLMRALLLLALCAALSACRSTPTPAIVTMPEPTAMATVTPARQPAPASPTAELPTTQPDTPVPTTPAPTNTPEPTATAAPFAPRVEVVAADLNVPWSLALAPDGRLFFTERPGRLRVIVDGVLQPEPLAEFDVVQSGEGGLLGIALDPDFAENTLLYIMYTYAADDGGTWNRLSRFPVLISGLGEEEVLLDRIPGAIYHDGGRLAFGPDGKLYVTTGDARNPDWAQDLDALAGKILRLNADGSIPDDNPVSGSPVYSLGHRNPQGLAFHPLTGLLYSTEHGPSGEFGLCCRDELNLIEAGNNYGWPIVTMAAGDARFVDPLLNSGSGDTWAPASLLAYGGEALFPWRGNLFFGALRGQHLQRVVLSDDGRTVIETERLFEGEYGRIRDAVEGPDGFIYFTTSNRDGRGDPAADDDRILRILPN